MDRSPLGSSVHGIFQQEYWSGLRFPPPGGGRPNPGIKPMSPTSLALQVDSLPQSHQRSSKEGLKINKTIYEALIPNLNEKSLIHNRLYFIGTQGGDGHEHGEQTERCAWMNQL